MREARPVIRIGTRRSPLAHAQTDRVLSLLPPGAAEKVPIESEGDKDQTTPVHHLDRPGAFTSVLTDAILDGRIEAAVHSLKDLPLRAPPEAPIVAILPRDDAADVLLVRDEVRDDARPLHLRPGSRVGTSAPRRQTQVLDADPELVPVDVRGNVGTRLRLLEAGVVDALLMAAAAFERMPLPLPPGVAKLRLAPERYPVGPGQGTIAVQARSGTDAARLLASLDDAPTRAAVETERALLARLGGGCGMPLGTYASPSGDGWRLVATLAQDGWEKDPRTRLRRADATAATPAGAVESALGMLQRPAPSPPLPRAPRTLLLTLPPESCRAYAEALAAAGWSVASWETIADAPTDAPAPREARTARWIAVPSPRAARHAHRILTVRGDTPRIAALGPATARALRALGHPVHVVAPDGTGASLAEAIAAFPAAPADVLIPQSKRALPDLADGLRARGFLPHEWPAYETRPAAPPLPARADAIVLTSPSNAEAYAAHPQRPEGVPLVAFGPTTADAMRRLGLPVHATCPRRSASGILEVLS